MIDPLFIAVGDASQVSAARLATQRLAHELEFDETRAGRVALVVTEAMTNLVRRGATVPAGHRIATALPQGTGTEWGWATRSGSPRAAPCYHEGMRTNSGKEMARFMQSLGAQVYDAPGRGRHGARAGAPAR